MSNIPMPSRDTTQLEPVLQRGVAEFLKRTKAAGLNVLITEVYRTSAYQDQLYSQGRTKPGKIVTNLRGGQSIHEYRCAFDICRNVKGKEYDDSDNFFLKCGIVWEEMGGEWGGRWKSFPDKPHFQFTAGFTDSQIRAGAKIPDDAKMPWEIKAEKEEQEEEETEMRFNKLNEIPEWGKATVEKLINKGAFGDKNALDLSMDMLRMFVIQDRLGRI